jgi:hypothetical protein
MIHHIDGRLRKFDVLDRFKVVGGDQPQALDIFIGDLVVDRFVDT